MPRTAWLAAAAAWAASSLLQLAGATSVPASALDWVSVAVYTAAWLLLAPAIVLAARIVPSRASRVLAAVIALGAIVAGIANLLSTIDSIDAAATWYVDGILLATILLVPLAYVFARDRSNALAIFALVVFLGLGFTAGGIGGLLVAAAFGALAYRAEWFRPRPRPVLPDMPVEVEPAS